jgi:hypothetical protein
MSDTIDNVSERLTRLEVTVAQGFHDCSLRDDALERKTDSLDRKFDAKFDALDRKIDSTADTLSRKIDANTDLLSRKIDDLAEEMRRSTDTIHLVLLDHSRRLNDLEDK